jgi:hypothetical protein
MPDQKLKIEAVLRETRGRVSGPDGAATRLGDTGIDIGIENSLSQDQ